LPAQFLGQIRLLQAVLFHQKSEYLGGRGIRHCLPFRFVGFHFLGHEIEQRHQAMRFVRSDAVEQLIHHRHTAFVILLAGDRDERHELVQSLPGGLHRGEIKVTFSDYAHFRLLLLRSLFHWSYSAWVKNSLI
jgi:hypothetical protein